MLLKSFAFGVVGVLSVLATAASAVTVTQQMVVASSHTGLLSDTVSIPRGTDLDAVQLDFVLSGGGPALLATAMCPGCNPGEDEVLHDLADFGWVPVTFANYSADTTFSLLDASGATVFSETILNLIIGSGGTLQGIDVPVDTFFSSLRIDFSPTLQMVGSNTNPNLPAPSVMFSTYVVQASDVDPIPLPAGLPLLAGGLGLIALLGYRKSGQTG